jgi:hypothetical protein
LDLRTRRFFVKQFSISYFLRKLSERTAAERPEEGSQGQAQSEAKRAAPGNERNSNQALKGRQKDAEDAR